MNKELLTIKDMFMSSLEEFAYKYPDEKIFTIFISCEPIYGSVFINIDTYDHSQKSIEWLKMKNHNDWIGVDKNGNFNNDGFDSKYIKFKEKYFEDWYNSYWNREEDECIFDILDEIKDSNNFKEYLEKNIENIEASFNNNFNKKYIVKDYFDNKIEINISGDDDEYNKYYF
ncbi:MAG: hypothetical protein LBQ93_07915, partial [Treponema sp.]|nr:hypothetical protein [Treponema sp.]